MEKRSLKKMSHNEFMKLLDSKAKDFKGFTEFVEYFEREFDLASDEHRAKAIKTYAIVLSEKKTPSYGTRIYD